jgi:peptidoglycan/xylan/chitin deacetylase (PgdA/CDA1 family)
LLLSALIPAGRAMDQRAAPETTVPNLETDRPTGALTAARTDAWRCSTPMDGVAQILDSVVPCAIILMHDGGGERSQTITALEQVLPQPAAQGYVFERLCL